jgi:hypothetical protein
MDHVSDTLNELREALQKARDNEISTARECLGQYVTDHRDTAAYRQIDRQVNQLAKAWDRMIARLDKWQTEAATIEASCENFYGD